MTIYYGIKLVLEESFMKYIYIALGTLFFLFSQASHSKTFIAEGSDLLMGVGPQQMGMAGAVTASTDDVYSTFWNPAGLSRIQGVDISIGKQVGSKLIPVNFIGIAASNSLLKGYGFDNSFAFAFIPRLHIYANGAFNEDDFESIFIRYALPDLPSDFNGEVTSKTKDHRLSWAIAPTNHPKWRFGLSLSYIECGSDFCGVDVSDPARGYFVSSTKATAIAVHMGSQFHYSDDLTLAVNLKDLNTKLDVNIVTTDSNGSEEMVLQTQFPRDLTFGSSWKYSQNLTFNNDLEFYYGDYGTYAVDFRFWRTGFSYQSSHWHYRGGLLVPLQMKSKKIKEFDLPYPFVPSMGVGWKGDNLRLDAVLYAHPVMSYQRRSPYPTVDISLSIGF